VGEKTVSKKRGKFDLIISKYGILFVLAAIIIVAGIISPAFLTGQNILNILKQVSATGMLAIGMTFVIISGGVDLSMGSILSLCGVVCVIMIPLVGTPLAILIALAVGVVCGTLNGIFITLTGGTMGSAFIITFGMATALGSLALTVTNGANVNAAAFADFKEIGQGSWGIVPITVVIFVVAVIAAQFVLRKTTFGRINYCLGINDEATHLSGIKVKKFRVLVYTVAGLFTALGAVMLCSRVSSASPIQGEGYELDAIAAVVLGGTRMGGGSGSAAKTVIGVLMFGILTNALNVMGVSSYQQMIVKGIIIMVAVLMDKRSIRVENEMLARTV
jgi:ribose/xylose/arabinose/galactoside ABC-type transport system permease subunit